MLSSIKAKIIIFYMGVFFLALSTLGAVLYFSIGKIVYDSVDASLLSRARALSVLINDNISESGSRASFDFSEDITREYGLNAGVFFQIRLPDGTIVKKSNSLGGSELPADSEGGWAVFETAFLNGVPVRLINYRMAVEYATGAGKGHVAGGRRAGLIVQCAEEIRGQLKLLRSYRIILVGSIVFIMFASASGGLLIAGKALAPVKDISDTVSRISEANLSERIKTEGIPGELAALASSFNRTFDSLDMLFRRQKQFAADASHELKVPLSVILSHSEIMLRRERTSAEYREAFKAVMEAAKMMSETVSKLLASARLSGERTELRLEDINPADLVCEAAGLLGPVAGRAGIRINGPERVAGRIRGDRAMLMELFFNLLDNSIKYNVSGGTVDISVRNETDFVVTEIKDTGIGIPENDLGRVFDRFYRVDKSRSRDTGGAGLGLSICDLIVKLHGGRIDIKSAPGSGTAVSVYLKRAPDDAEA